MGLIVAKTPIVGEDVAWLGTLLEYSFVAPVGIEVAAGLLDLVGVLVGLSVEFWLLLG